MYARQIDRGTAQDAETQLSTPADEDMDDAVNVTP